jgi:hypothetical protein
MELHDSQQYQENTFGLFSACQILNDEMANCQNFDEQVTHAVGLFVSKIRSRFSQFVFINIFTYTGVSTSQTLSHRTLS